MSSVKITQLPAADVLGDTDLFEVVQAGQSRRLSAAQLGAGLCADVLGAVEEDLAAAEQAALAAAVARDAALATGQVFASTVAGLAATAEGQYFSVVQADALVLYRRVAGVAVEALRYPSLAVLQAAQADIAAAQTDIAAARSALVGVAADLIQTQTVVAENHAFN